MRVSQRQRFNFFINNMNDSLTELMELNVKAASQKRINRPSDDPVGTARVLGHRDAIKALKRYKENADDAKGWLNIADTTLIEVNTILTRFRELAEQSATGTVGADNREQISYEARQLFDQLLNMANTKFEGKYIFGGQKTTTQAFEKRLWLTTNDDNLASQSFSISGDSEKTVLVRFLASGAVGSDQLSYEYSADGGRTFTSATLASNANVLNLTGAGVRLTLASGASVSAYDSSVPGANGSWLWIRPTAQYKGDDVDNIDISVFGGSTLNTSASGSFNRNVTVRIDSGAALNSNISYSYSLDGGINWTNGNTVTGTASSAVLVVPGGFLTLTSNGGNSLTAGDQFVIRPRTGKIMVEIGAGEALQVNNIGKDVFGGVYQDPNSSSPGVVFGGSDKNLFETLGKLVGYLETNTQSGCQEALNSLNEVSKHIMNVAAQVGARENRIDFAQDTLETMWLTAEDRMSDVEDIDIAELMTDLANQQIVYETVLRSSSMIMRMSLANFI
ncbi:MAG: flagellar hook-associated protein FlgL [Thermodesulfobacteriota bacterium]